MSRPLAILDYGMGNLRSVQKAFEQVGHAAEIISRPEQIAASERLVLPGVGAFQDAIAHLRQADLVEPILQHIRHGRPFLGICLGLQLLVETGLEDGEHRGLGLIGGQCVRFEVDRTLGLKVPHMGWNTLDVARPSPLLKGLPPQCGVYFVHSYHVVPADASVIATTTDYGGPFVSSIWRDNVVATQFHPEKSQKVGLAMLANFAEWKPGD